MPSTSTGPLCGLCSPSAPITRRHVAVCSVPSTRYRTTGALPRCRSISEMSRNTRAGRHRLHKRLARGRMPHAENAGHAREDLVQFDRSRLCVGPAPVCRRTARSGIAVFRRRASTFRGGPDAEPRPLPRLEPFAPHAVPVDRRPFGHQNRLAGSCQHRGESIARNSLLRRSLRRSLGAEGTWPTSTSDHARYLLKRLLSRVCCASAPSGAARAPASEVSRKRRRSMPGR